MKRLLSFATAAMVVLSMNAFAEYHTSTATTCITVDVQIPILVTATPSCLCLGDLAPGVTRQLGDLGTDDNDAPSGPAVLFTVNGAYGWPFTVEPLVDPVDVTPGSLNGLVTLTGAWYTGSDDSHLTKYVAEDPDDLPQNPNFYYLGKDENGKGIGHHALYAHPILPGQTEPNEICPWDGLPTPGGNYYFQYVVTSMTAADLAIVGTYCFEITLTASYANVNIDLTGYALLTTP